MAEQRLFNYFLAYTKEKVMKFGMLVHNIVIYLPMRKVVILIPFLIIEFKVK